MRRAAHALCLAALLAGPFVLAFFSGGYYDSARSGAGVIAWSVVALAALTLDRPLPRRRAPRMALAGMALLLAWTALSLLWAPLAGPAFHDAQRLALYLGTLIAAAAFLRGRAVGRSIEPTLAAGALIVIGYALSERLLPGVVTLARPASAAGRLVEPLGYWNAMGILAALGFLSAARIAGDPTRPDGFRAGGAAAAVPLGLGLYLSFSRGAIAALALGLVVLLAAARSWPQLRAIALTLECAVVTALVASRLHGVEKLTGGGSTREWQGAVMLAVLVAAMLVAGVVQVRGARLERDGRLRDGMLPLPARAPAMAAIAVALVAAVVVAAGSSERHGAGRVPENATATRFTSLGSARYEYWKVALSAFGDHPLKGLGSGDFGVVWLRERTVRESAQDAHSLYIETAAELGLVGLAVLALLLTGVALCARAAWRHDPVLTAGSCAVLAAWALHAGLDWDWEMPTVTLIAIVLAGAAMAAAESTPGPTSSRGHSSG